MTAGLNLSMSSNMRGDIYLSITTNQTTHMIHEERPSPSIMKSARKIEAIAKGLLSKQDQTMPTKTELPKPVLSGETTTLGDQLSRLAELHQNGSLSDSEFIAAKSKLIDN